MKLKIAQIVPYYYPSIGGVQAVAKYIAEGLANRGHIVDVLTYNRDHSGRDKLNASKFEVLNGVQIYRFKSYLNLGHMSLFSPTFINHLLKNDYDVLHYHNYRHPHCEISSLIGKNKKTINVLHGHGPFFEIGEINELRNRVYNLYDRFSKYSVLKNSDVIIALNDYEKEKYLCIGVPENKIEIIPNAAEEESFRFEEPDPFIIKFNLIKKNILLFLGILNTSKRPDILVKAMPYIIKENPDAHLVIAGPDGGMLQTVKSLVSELHLENHITLTGPLFGKEKHQAYCGAKLFLLSSDLDAYPLVLTEAMAHGLPIITTDARGPLSIVRDKETGFIVPKGDEFSFAEKVNLLLKDDSLRKKIAENGMRYAKERFQVQSITTDLEKIYLKLIQSKSAYEKN